MGECASTHLVRVSDLVRVGVRFRVRVRIRVRVRVRLDARGQVGVRVGRLIPVWLGVARQG